MPTVTRANVRVNSIHVLDSSVNTTSEPGSSAEWFMTFIVNGQAAQWSNENVKDDTVYAVNRDFPNIDLNPNQTISIQVSGYEEDDTSANDPLPTTSFVINPAEDFELGGTRWSGLAQSEEGSYNIEYTVMPAAQEALTQAREFVGVYRAGHGKYGLWSGNWKNFTKKWKEWSDAGLRLTRLSTFRQDTGVVSFGDSTERFFLGAFSEGGDGYALWAGEWTQFEAEWKKLGKDGLRLVDVASYKDGDEQMFAGVFRSGTDAHALYASDWGSFNAKWQELAKDGLRLVALDTYVQGGKRMFVGAFRAGTDNHALVAGLDWKSFRAKWKELSGQGLRLVDIAGYDGGDKELFAGVFRAGTDSFALRRGSWTEFDGDWKELCKSGYRLVSCDTFLEGKEE